MSTEPREQATDLPSAEAHEHACAAWDERLDHRRQAEATLAAAYAIDVPRIRAEERAATVREVIEWLRTGDVAMRAASRAVGEHFNPEAEPSQADSQRRSRPEASNPAAQENERGTT